MSKIKHIDKNVLFKKFYITKKLKKIKNEKNINDFVNAKLKCIKMNSIAIIKNEKKNMSKKN